MKPLRNRFFVVAIAQRNHCAITAKALRDSRAFAAIVQRKTITANFLRHWLRNPCEIVTQSLHNHSEIAA
jgi:hypothetical protein